MISHFYRPPSVALPPVRRVRQNFPQVSFDADTVLTAQLKAYLETHPLAPGSRVAITCGSRGINRIAELAKLTVNILRHYSLIPFLVPAMGSHGGATPEGQTEVLRQLGISEHSCGAPVVSSMEVADLGVTSSGVPVYTDLNAYRADAIIVINRVKLHTDFRGTVESGIMKMVAIGLGNQKGANTLHRMGVDRFSTLIPEVGSHVIQHAPIYCAIPLIEDWLHQLCHLEVVAPEEILSREQALLRIAKQKQAKIYADCFDVLVVQEIGKEINGDGMDPNVTGRFGVPGLTGGSAIQKVVVLDLSKQTKGNACGIGLADITTARAVSKIDFSKTYMNVITATVTNGARLPIVMMNDKDALMAAAQTCSRVEPDQVRMVIIRNTNCLIEFLASVPLCNEMANSDMWQFISDPEPLSFDEEGNLLSKIPD